MPELPEVERVRAELAERVVGLTISGVRVHRRDVVTLPGDPSGGFARQRRQAVTPKRVNTALLGRDQVIRAIDRHGKALGILADAAMGIHLGMTGMVLVLAPRERPPQVDHLHVEWSLATPSGEPAGRMLFRDPRRFGGVWGFGSAAGLEEHRQARMGPDALLADAEGFLARVRASQRNLKAILLDQRVIAGVGNIYADEALFRSQLAPSQLGTATSAHEARTLLTQVRAVLQEAIELGGSTIRDYAGIDGTSGAAQMIHRVYGRGGQPCTRCNDPLSSGVLAGRTTVWCAECQPVPRPTRE